MKSNTVINKQLLNYLVAFLTLALSLQLIKKINWKLNRGVYESYNWLEFFVYEFVAEWLIVVAFMTISYYLTNKMIDKNFQLKIMFLIHALFSFLLGFTTLCSITVIGYFTGLLSVNEAIDNISFDRFLAGVDKDFLIYFSSISIIYVYSYVNKIKGIELQKSKLQTQLVTSKLQMLRSQLHPHFMFNTLNSISSLIDIDPEKSQNVIADFGDLFRGIIEHNDEALIPLSKELEFLDKYLDIIAVRFSDHLIIRNTITDGLEQELVPSLLIQPLIENAVKHGYSYEHTELVISISIYKIEQYVYIEISNNGTPLSADFETLLSLGNGSGIKITNERLQSIYETNYKFYLKNCSDRGVVALIKIPAA
ncbi:histidine kinase [Oceanihabitans sediminis]|uniref:sensor histidine kinase n=1 Tax=Flavobacteriaceae TaxID=49546 RepID=UPI00299E44BF|nr:histidine kinase [Oceanihabitans sediminis]MDX1279419.1 histidine kinase [Oceanihabitans sediminis]